ncbi:hypothetical protein KFU94_31280 [Chloroflexi bacterium TSY]|nr:hypothetical protein [Chloroflexi bacterium TSY]
MLTTTDLRWAQATPPTLAGQLGPASFNAAFNPLSLLLLPFFLGRLSRSNLAFLAIFSRDCRDFGVIYSDFGYRKQPISYLKIAQI